ncbi:MAG: rhodanese-like domain-containing protein [Candidatus Competibacterales bacterium]
MVLRLSPWILGLCVLPLTACQFLAERPDDASQPVAEQSEAPPPPPPPVDPNAVPDLPLADNSDVVLASIKVANLDYADETKDYGLGPVTTLLYDSLRHPTTTTVPGGEVIRTYDLVELMRKEGPKPVIVNVIPGQQARIIPGAVWLSGAGRSSRLGQDDVIKRLGTHLTRLTGGNKTRPVVIYCLDNRCWYAYNAAQRASRLGYRNVYWYRGGIKAWRSAGLPYTTAQEDLW